jgi:uncharacterized membrane protein
MKPLLLLLAAFGLSLFTIKFISGNYNVVTSARIAMSAMLAFTAIGHFKFTKGMAMMMPDVIPFKKQLVYITGVIEVLAAIGIQITAFRALTAWLLIVFFIVLLPANIKAAFKHIDYEKATTSGEGLKYLWFRIPLQILFIAWTYFCCIKF